MKILIFSLICLSANVHAEINSNFVDAVGKHPTYHDDKNHGTANIYKPRMNSKGKKSQGESHTVISGYIPDAMLVSFPWRKVGYKIVEAGEQASKVEGTLHIPGSHNGGMTPSDIHPVQLAHIKPMFGRGEEADIEQNLKKRARQYDLIRWRAKINIEDDKKAIILTQKSAEAREIFHAAKPLPPENVPVKTAEELETEKAIAKEVEEREQEKLDYVAEDLQRWKEKIKSGEMKYWRFNENEYMHDMEQIYGKKALAQEKHEMSARMRKLGWSENDIEVQMKAHEAVRMGNYIKERSEVMKGFPANDKPKQPMRGDPSTFAKKYKAQIEKEFRELGHEKGSIMHGDGARLTPELD